MGGNLFSHLRRLTKSEYTEIESLVVSKLTNYNIPYSLIPYYKNKDSFGDLDILVDFADVNNTLPSFLEKVFNDDKYEFKYYKNGNVHSIRYLGFQVDFINVFKDKFGINQFYFSYNDLNNLVGKLARRLNCKLGNNGLFYKHYSSDKSKKIEWFLSDNPREIYGFLELDYETYLKGFDELQDIYNFVMSSDLFIPNIYDLLKHKDRVRDKKRTTYINFLEYIKNNPRYSYFKLPLNIPQYVGDYFKVDLEQKIKEWDNQQKLNKQLKEKYNGKIVSGITNLTDKELGKFISYMNSKIKVLNLNLIDWTPEQIKNYIIKEKVIYDKIQKNKK